MDLEPLWGYREIKACIGQKIWGLSMDVFKCAPIVVDVPLVHVRLIAPSDDHHPIDRSDQACLKRRLITVSSLLFCLLACAFVNVPAQASYCTINGCVVTAWRPIFPSSPGVNAAAFSFNEIRPARIEFRENRSSSEDQTDRDSGSKDCPQGNPIIIATGNKIEPEQDFVSEGEAGLHFERTWNNYWTGYGLFGYRWITSFDYRLSFETSYDAGCYPYPGNPECTNSANAMTVWAHRNDGRKIKYVKNAADGVYYEDKPQPVSRIARQPNGRWVLYTETDGTETYSVGGYPITVLNKHGIGWTFTHGGQNGTQLQRVTHTSGRYVDLVWTGNRITTIRDPSLAAYTYTYNQNGRLRTTTLPGSPATVITYHYSGEAGEPTYSFSPLTGKTINGVRYSRFTYTSDRYAASTEHAGGIERFSFVYTPGQNNTLSVLETNPLGKQTTYDFQNGRLLTVIGHASTHCPATGRGNTYDSNGNPDVVTDNKGNVTNYDYNAKGQLLKMVEGYGKPEARTTTNTWDTTANRILNTIIEGESKTAYTYTPDNRIQTVSVTNLSSNGVQNQTRTTTYSYSKHSNGMLATVIEDGPLPATSDAITYSYSAAGDLLKSINNAGHEITYSNHTALGLPQRITNANGGVIEYVYDARSRPTHIKRYVDGTPYTTIIAYNAFGETDSIQTPDNQKRYFLYDDARRLRAEYELEADGTYIQKRYTYNNASLVTRVDTERTSAVIPPDIPSLAAPPLAEGGTYSVSWNAPARAEIYTLEESLNQNAWVVVYSGGALAVNYTSKPTGTYRYRVKACNPAGCSAYSPTRQVEVVPFGVPSLTVSPTYTTTGSFTVSWSAVGSATSYQLEQSRDGGAWTLDYNGPATSVSRVRPTGEFTYRVKACGSAGCGGYSPIRGVSVDRPDQCPSCLVAPPPPEKPSGSAAADNGGDQ